MASAVQQQRSEWEGCGGVFSVDWISRESLSFQSTKHISNLWNGNNKLATSRDAQVTFNHFITMEKLRVFHGGVYDPAVDLLNTSSKMLQSRCDKTEHKVMNV